MIWLPVVGDPVYHVLCPSNVKAHKRLSHNDISDWWSVPRIGDPATCRYNTDPIALQSASRLDRFVRGGKTDFYARASPFRVPDGQLSPVCLDDSA